MVSSLEEAKKGMSKLSRGRFSHGLNLRRIINSRASLLFRLDPALLVAIFRDVLLFLFIEMKLTLELSSRKYCERTYFLYAYHKIILMHS